MRCFNLCSNIYVKLHPQVYSFQLSTINPFTCSFKDSISIMTSLNYLYRQLFFSFNLAHSLKNWLWVICQSRSTLESHRDHSSRVSTNIGGSTFLKPTLLIEAGKAIRLTFFSAFEFLELSESDSSLIHALRALPLAFRKLGHSVLICPKPKHLKH